MGPISGLDFGRPRNETNSYFRAVGGQIVARKLGSFSGPPGGPIWGSSWLLLNPPTMGSGAI